MKATIFHNNEHANSIISDSNITTGNVQKTSNTFTLSSPHNTSVLEKTTKSLTPHPMTLIHQNKHHMCTKLAQLRANKSPLLHTVNHDTDMPQCPLCLKHKYETNHLFNFNLSQKINLIQQENVENY